MSPSSGGSWDGSVSAVADPGALVSGDTWPMEPAPAWEFEQESFPADWFTGDLGGGENLSEYIIGGASEEMGTLDYPAPGGMPCCGGCAERGGCEQGIDPDQDAYRGAGATSRPWLETWTGLSDGGESKGHEVSRYCECEASGRSESGEGSDGAEFLGTVQMTGDCDDEATAACNAVWGYDNCDPHSSLTREEYEACIHRPHRRRTKGRTFHSCWKMVSDACWGAKKCASDLKESKRKCRDRCLYHYGPSLEDVVVVILGGVRKKVGKVLKAAGQMMDRGDCYDKCAAERSYCDKKRESALKGLAGRHNACCRVRKKIKEMVG